jgi:RNA polymerase sigma factor (sigma-70 family)
MPYMEKELIDLRILELFREPDSRDEAFALLLNTYQQPVYWLIRRMVFGHEDANDLVQDTFVKIWQNLDGFREESKLYTWIYRIAANEALAFIKRRQKQKQVPWDVYQDNEGKWLTADHYFKGDDIQYRLQMAIQQLPPQQRIIFNLRYFDEMKYEEMSRVLSLTEGALKASYHHAAKKIEKYITRD